MEIIEQTSGKLILRMHAKESLANALRRSISEIPVLAIDEVEIFKNDSALYDEFLAHRVGLVVLKNQSANEKTAIELKLVKEGPGTVSAGDFKGDAEIVYPATPLTLLEKSQEVELIATARVGRGVDHEKYTPGLCFYRHLLLVRSKNPHVIKLVENSRGVIKAEKHKDGFICDLNEALADEIEKLDASAITDSDELIMIIESFGQMNAKEILLKAIDALGENLGEFEKSLK